MQLFEAQSWFHWPHNATSSLILRQDHFLNSGWNCPAKHEKCGSYREVDCTTVDKACAKIKNVPVSVACSTSAVMVCQHCKATSQPQKSIFPAGWNCLTLIWLLVFELFLVLGRTFYMCSNSQCSFLSTHIQMSLFERLTKGISGWWPCLCKWCIAKEKVNCYLYHHFLGGVTLSIFLHIDWVACRNVSDCIMQRMPSCEEQRNRWGR